MAQAQTKDAAETKPQLKTESEVRFAKDQLKAFVERIERLEEEKTVLADDVKSVLAEAKATGFDTKIIRTVVRLRKMDADERAEHDAILDTYLSALGMAL